MSDQKRLKPTAEVVAYAIISTPGAIEEGVGGDQPHLYYGTFTAEDVCNVIWPDYWTVPEGMKVADFIHRAVDRGFLSEAGPDNRMRPHYRIRNFSFVAHGDDA